MPNLSIKDVPEEWAEALRQRAALHHRSLQGELMALVERAVHEALPTAVPFVPDREGSGKKPRVVGYDRLGSPVLRQGSKTPEEVFGLMRAQGLKPRRGQPLAVDILRRDRDSR